MEVCDSTTDVPNDDSITNSQSFKFKTKITGNTKNFEIVVPVKYLTNFWRTLEVSLFNYESNLNWIWRADGIISFATGASFVITNAELYILVVALSTQDNVQLLQHLINFIQTQK